MKRDKPFWMPDTQGFLAIAIIGVVAALAFILIGTTIKFDDKVAGAFMTLLGVLTACLKDVYSFFFGSSKGSEKKDDAIIAGSITTTSPNGTGPAKTTTTSEPEKVTTVVEPALAGKALAMIAVLILGTLFVAPAFAQTQLLPKRTLQLPIDPLGLNDRPASPGSPLGNILGALDDKLLADLQYAKKLADATGSRVTAPCYQAWIDLIVTRQKAIVGADGQPIDLPNPRLITDFEKAVELRNALQPDSDFMIKCSPVASMVKKDIIGFIGQVLAGGAGLATLVPGL